jgi:hypothetical protein
MRLPGPLPGQPRRSGASALRTTAARRQALCRSARLPCKWASEESWPAGACATPGRWARRDCTGPTCLSRTAPRPNPSPPAAACGGWPKPFPRPSGGGASCACRTRAGRNGCPESTASAARQRSWTGRPRMAALRLASSWGCKGGPLSCEPGHSAPQRAAIRHQRRERVMRWDQSSSARIVHTVTWRLTSTWLSSRTTTSLGGLAGALREGPAFPLRTGGLGGLEPGAAARLELRPPGFGTRIVASNDHERRATTQLQQIPCLFRAMTAFLLAPALLSRPSSSPGHWRRERGSKQAQEGKHLLEPRTFVRFRREGPASHSGKARSLLPPDCPGG